MNSTRKLVKETVKAKLVGTKHNHHTVYARVLTAMQLDHGVNIYRTPEAQLVSLASKLADDYLAAR